MRFLFIFCFLISACSHISQHASVTSSVLVLKTHLREPASLSCETLFENNLSQKLQHIKNFLQSEVLSWFRELKTSYKNNLSTTENYREVAGIDRHNFRYSYGKALHNKFLQGDPAIKHYIELGYKESIDASGDKVLIPSKSYEEMIIILYSKLLSIAKERNIPFDQLILPGLVFHKKSTNSILVVRPGIDPIPSYAEGWRLSADGLEIEALLFAEFVAQGKYPCDPAMFYHDIGHFIDFLEHPETMVAVKTYFTKKVDFLKRHSIQQLKEEWPYFSKFYKEENSSTPIDDEPTVFEHLLFEANYIAKPGSEKLLESILGPETGPHASRADLVKKYEKLSTDKLVQLGQKLNEQFYNVVEVYGGTARDRDTTTFQFQYSFGFRLFELLTNQAYPQYRNYQSLDFHIDGLSFLYFQLKIANEILSKGSYGTIDIQHVKDTISHIKTTPSPKIPITDELAKKNLRQFIILTLAEIEWRQRLGLKLKLTPHKMIEDFSKIFDSGGVEEYKRSDTYKYFLQTSYPNDSIWYYYVNIP